MWTKVPKGNLHCHHASKLPSVDRKQFRSTLCDTATHENGRIVWLRGVILESNPRKLCSWYVDASGRTSCHYYNNERWSAPYFHLRSTLHDDIPVSIWTQSSHPMELYGVHLCQPLRLHFPGISSYSIMALHP